MSTAAQPVAPRSKSRLTARSTAAIGLSTSTQATPVIRVDVDVEVDVTSEPCQFTYPQSIDRNACANSVVGSDVLHHAEKTALRLDLSMVNCRDERS